MTFTFWPQAVYFGQTSTVKLNGLGLAWSYMSSIQERENLPAWVLLLSRTAYLQKLFQVKLSERGFGITPELKLNMFEVEAEVSGSMDKTEEYIFYEPQITSFGLNTSKVAWDFRSTKEMAVLGDKKLQLVIQTPKGTKVKGKFLLSPSSFAKSSRAPRWCKCK